jgi:hypothetical protein
VPERKLVLVVPDAELRSAIVGCLTAGCIEVVAAARADDPAIPHAMRCAALLAIDEDALDGPVEALAHTGGWARVVVLSGAVAERTSGFDWLAYLDRRRAGELLPGFADGLPERASPQRD